MRVNIGKIYRVGQKVPVSNMPFFNDKIEWKTVAKVELHETLDGNEIGECPIYTDGTRGLIVTRPFKNLP